MVEIVYEDKDILVINKPAGLAVHPGDNIKDETVVGFLTQKYPEIKSVGDEPDLRPGIVHRLDRDTSGILLVAKNQRAFEYFKNLFKEKKIKKKYIALVSGKLKAESGIIDLPIGKSKSDFRKKTSVGKIAGKQREAVTEYKVKERFPDYDFVEVYPKTGRTHQIRVHFKAIGHPVICDKLYGFKNQKCPPGLDRHFLHASGLEFVHTDGSQIKLEADLPDELTTVLKELRKNK